MEGYIIFFIAWLISNIAALPFFCVVMMDGNSSFFIPIEIWSRLQRRFSKPIAIILSCIICAWLSFIILLNIIACVVLFLFILVLFAFWCIYDRIFIGESDNE